MRNLLLLIFTVLILSNSLYSQSVTVLESTEQKLTFTVDFNNSYIFIDTLIEGKKFEKIVGNDPALRTEGEPWLPTYSTNIGIPHNVKVLKKIRSESSLTFKNKYLLPYPGTNNDGTVKYDMVFNEDIYSNKAFYPSQKIDLLEPYIFRFAKIQPIVFSPFQYNPVTRELIFNKTITVEVDFYDTGNINYQKIYDEPSLSFVSNNTLNPDISKNWIGKENNQSQRKVEDENWYDAAKKYTKIFVKDKDVYRVTYEDIQTQAGLNGTSIDSYKLELYNLGEFVPIEIIDGGDNLFGPGDHFTFVGYPPPKSEYTYFNLYNNNNVYWLSTEGDSSSLRFNYIDAYPSTYNTTIKEHKATVHFEKDSLLERLGYASNGERDYWFWGEARGSNGTPTKIFSRQFEPFLDKSTDNDNMVARVNLHGLNNLSCANDNKAQISITDQYIGEIEWDGQSAATFEKSFVNSADSIQIYPTGNYFQVAANGLTCNPAYNNVIRINWFEIDYWRFNRSLTGDKQFFTIQTPQSSTVARFVVFNWLKNNIKIYVPSKNRILENAFFWNDVSNTLTFRDTVNSEIDYFCVSDDYVRSPLLIEAHSNSNIRDVNLGADYLIITHPDFTSAAIRLKNFREQNLEGYDNPRVQIIDINDIYDEFSYGLLDPNAITKFIKYTFDSWTGTPPLYLALLGDMSYDYRKLLQSSRKNFIPSLPYHAIQYGLAFSDNNFVSVVGDDLVPEMAVGRLSCETLEEANILIDKIIDYPADNSKVWKEKVLLIGAGQDEADENRFGFNDDNVALENNYLTPNGYTSQKVFRFPNRPEYLQFQGEGPQIREAFNNGAILSNFYGHGGGAQWDLVFSNDDIYLLENGNKLPFVLSVSCYTAHFDNQTAFGEIFNRVPGKGSIGFWGNTGLTFYGYGKSINNQLFEELFTNNNVVVGNALLNAKVDFAGNGAQFGPIKDHLALFTLLGDPAVKLALPEHPDFTIAQNNISIVPASPVVGDTISIKSIITNYGRDFKNDSLSVQYYIVYDDTSFLIHEQKLSSFGQTDSITFKWVPEDDGNVILKSVLNDKDIIDEIDRTDNETQLLFTIYDLRDPNIIKPIEGYFTTTGTVEFLFADVGHYIDLNLQYFIEIDTTLDFSSPIFQSTAIIPNDGMLSFSKTNIDAGIYFWRARLFDGNKYSNWSTPKSFSVGSENNFGFLATGKQLSLFEKQNFIFSDSLNSLLMNTKLQPPKPSTDKVIDSIFVQIDNPNFLMTSITTDGQYLYFANKSFYNSFQPSPIYKIGTGINSVQGASYDSIPNFSATILNQIFYHNEYIYVIDGNAYSIIMLNPETGDSTLVQIPEGLLDNTSGKVESFISAYACSDGRYIYNIAFKDSSDGANVFVIRKFDPENNWQKIGPDLRTTSSSWGGQFSGFFVAKGYIYPYESFTSGWMKKIRLSDGFFEEEFLTNSIEEGFQAYHAWCYDDLNDIVYASVARIGFENQIRSFVGTFKRSSGSVTTPLIGYASSWQNLSYDIDLNGYTGNYSNILLGFNNETKKLDSLMRNIGPNQDLSQISASKYKEIKFKHIFVDSSVGQSFPPIVSKVKVEYTSLPEIVLKKNSITFSPDSLLQGLDLTLDFSASNYGYSNADSVSIKLFINEVDSAIFSNTLSVNTDSTVFLSHTINTSQYLFFNKVKLTAESKNPEFYSFNNVIKDSFYVARDSVKPEFQITFDGLEIISGDVVSATPNIFISMKDNSPLPIDTSNFFIYLNNNPLSFTKDSLIYSYTAYPNSESQINWKPKLINGKHVLDVLAKDASGNFFDTTSYRVSFVVDRENKVYDIYNYPNPFADDTYFTFNISGTELPEDMNVKIFTVAGRLIRDFDIPVNQLGFGFNKIYWDGKDQDGNSIANGVYFCKFNILNNGEYSSEVKKIAKVK